MRGLADGERWAVVSDVHANAGAFRAAIARCADADRVICLGDLLTYGAEPGPCMDLLADLVATRPTDLVLGNHDQLYIDLLRGETAYYDGLPAWLREAVDWTAERIDPAWFRELPWVERVAHGEILAAHANPWTYGDWRYLNHADDLREAAATLSEGGYALGLFGHTHRPRVWDAGEPVGERAFELPTPEEPLVVNPGSVGQPRTTDKTASMCRIRRTDRRLFVSWEAVEYDVGAHRHALGRTGLSPLTLERLLRYFPPDA